MAIVPAWLLVAACGMDTGPLPPVVTSQVHSVTVSPANVALQPGDSVQFVAVVQADPGLSRDVVWRSTDPLSVSVSPTGLAVSPRCGPDGGGQILAIAVADTNKRGAALVSTLLRTFLSIGSLHDSSTGQSQDLASAHGTIRVAVLHPRSGCPLDSLQLMIRGPGLDTTLAAGGVAGALDGPLFLYWASGTQRSGNPVFPNGQYQIAPRAVMRGPIGPVTGRPVPLLLANP